VLREEQVAATSEAKSAITHYVSRQIKLAMNIQSLDTKLLLLINHGTANSLFDILMPALSQRGYLLIIPFLLAMVLRGMRQKDKMGKTFLTPAIWTIAVSICALFFAEVVEYAMKHATARLRPCQVIEGIRLIITCPSSYSMPSGHAISSFAIALPLFYLTQEYIALIWRLYLFCLLRLSLFLEYIWRSLSFRCSCRALLGAIIGLVLSSLYQLMRLNRS
jgi:undecaprenyl-diphosphatase